MICNELGHSSGSPFFRQKVLGNVRCCYFLALMLTYYRLKKDRATCYRPVTIVTSLLLLMVLSFKVPFLVLHFRSSAGVVTRGQPGTGLLDIESVV